MRVLFLWLALGLGVAGGYAIGSLGPPTQLQTMGWVGLVGAAGVTAIATTAWRGAVRACSFTLVALAVLVGLEAAREHRSAAWPTSARGAAEGLRELEVVGASFTGSRCEVAAREPGCGVKLWLSAPVETCPLSHGQRVVVLASTMRFAEHVRLPGGIDPRRMVLPRGTVLAVRVDALWTLERPTSSYWRWVAEQRHRAWAWTRGDDAAAFVVASALGVRVALAPERRAEVRRAGLGHLIAVSGLHVALAAWLVHVSCIRVASLLGRPPAWGIVASWLPLAGYVGLTGASAPAVRAAAMLVLFGVGMVVGRPTQGLHLLAVAAAAMLLARPAWAVDPGFQLSLAAMAALVRAPPGTGLVGHSWRISWAILPVSSIHFGETGAYSIVSNLVAIPLFTIWVLPAALLGWLLTAWMGPSVLAPAAAGAEIVLDLSAAVAELPPVSLDAAAIVAVLGLASAFWFGTRPWLRRIAPPWLASVATLAAWAWVASRPTVEPGAWVAVGKPRAYAVVAVTTDAEGRFACLHGSTLGAAAWLRMFDTLGIERIAAVEPGHTGEPGDAPHLRELRRTFRRERRWGGHAASCGVPDADVIAAALEQCSRRIGGGRAVVLAPTEHEPMRCFVGGEYEPLHPNRKDLEP